MSRIPPESDLTDPPDLRLNSPMQAAETMRFDETPDGDAEVFRAVVEENSRKMFRLAYRMTGNEQDAEDVVQETFLRAYGKLGQYQSRAHMASWLHRIAANYAIDLLRRRKRWRSSDLDSHEEHSPLKSVAPDPDRELHGVEVQRRVSAELEKLTPKERIAFTLRHHEGLSIKEIAEITGSGISATKNHIFRAVHKMRKALKPWAGEA